MASRQARQSSTSKSSRSGSPGAGGRRYVKWRAELFQDRASAFARARRTALTAAGQPLRRARLGVADVVTASCSRLYASSRSGDPSVSYVAAACVTAIGVARLAWSKLASSVQASRFDPPVRRVRTTPRICDVRQPPNVGTMLLSEVAVPEVAWCCRRRAGCAVRISATLGAATPSRACPASSTVRGTVDAASRCPLVPPPSRCVAARGHASGLVASAARAEAPQQPRADRSRRPHDVSALSAARNITPRALRWSCRHRSEMISQNSASVEVRSASNIATKQPICWCGGVGSCHSAGSFTDEVSTARSARTSQYGEPSWSRVCLPPTCRRRGQAHRATCRRWRMTPHGAPKRASSLLRHSVSHLRHQGCRAARREPAAPGAQEPWCRGSRLAGEKILASADPDSLGLQPSQGLTR